MRTRVPMPTWRTIDRGRQLPVGGGEVAGDAQRLFGGRFTLLRVEVDEQDQIGRLAAKRRLDRVCSTSGLGNAPPLCPRPFSTRIPSSCTTGRRWSADSAAGRIARRPANESRDRRNAESIRGSRHRDRRWSAPSPCIRRELPSFSPFRLPIVIPAKGNPGAEVSSLAPCSNQGPAMDPRLLRGQQEPRGLPTRAA